MVDMYNGTPGSGKSLHAAEKIYFSLKLGRPVIANFEIDISKIRKPKAIFTYVSNEMLTPEFLRNYAYDYWKGKRVVEDTIVLIIDEAQLLFNCREWAKSGRADWTSFFTQHRKLGYKIILICQFDAMLDKQIRSLVEYQYIHRKVSNFGAFGKVMSVLSLGGLFVSVQIWYPLGEKIGNEFYKAKKKYYSLYDTYLLLDQQENEKNTSAVSSL